MKSQHRNWKVLFIDDSQTEINYLKLFFQFTDVPIEAKFINSASKALDTLAKMDIADFPEVIIVDINMPLMDGFEFAEAYIKQFKEKNTNTHLFIYSTSIHSADIRRVESIAGVTGFIPKPFSDNTFENYISPHLIPVKTVEAENN